MKKIEKVIEKALLICAIAATFSVILISIFIFKEGASVITDYGVKEFVLGRKWSPTNGYFGILPLILGSLSVTIGALILGVPLGIGCAIFLAKIAPSYLRKIVRAGVDLLAGIPSVVYGFFGLAVIVPLIRQIVMGISKALDLGYKTTGYSIFAGAIILAIMILPTIISISETAISAVPKEYEEGSLALGASKIETIFKVILPAAKSGVLSSVILGMGRAIGETMAVILITGNMPKVPGSVFDSVATLTGTIAMEMGYATYEHQKALFAIGIVLFIMIMLLNIIANYSVRKFEQV